ncbi:YqcC family protein [Colwellia asteriadis]|uniref:YqcC family protein n=1 Tax=Colwellia asteriadis TaxID=517723 RepID=A0ABN1L601_9GAMM
MNTNQKAHISVLLNDLTQALKAQHLWQDIPPATEKLKSKLPFCVDTLFFEQWLQFIFLPKMQHLLNENLPLPSSISLSPMAEEAFKRLGSEANSLLSIIAAIDLSLTQPSMQG